MRGKGVPRKAEGANPKTCPHIDLAKSCQYLFKWADFANYRLELQEGSIRLLFKRSIQCANWYNKAGGFLWYLSVLKKLGMWAVLPFES
jgi:hypothetical protein